MTQLGLTFRALPANIDEVQGALESPEAFCQRLAEEKALTVRKTLEPALACAPSERAVVLGADTVVVLDGAVLGKPRDSQEARGFLQRLSGRKHHVLTAVAVQGGCTEPSATVVRTAVWFRPLDGPTCDGYVASREGMDKAGGYAIQGLGAGLIQRIAGSYHSVVGLPVAETLCLLARAGALPVWPAPASPGGTASPGGDRR